MGRAGLNRKTALATLTLALAAEAPDLDVLLGSKVPLLALLTIGDSPIRSWEYRWSP